jgi:chromosome segregation protein
LEQFNKEEQEKRDALVHLQKTLSDVNQRLSEVVRTTNQYAVEIARLETRSEDLDREMRQDMPHEAIEQVKKNKPSSIDRGETYSQILQLKKQLEMIGGIDPQVEKEYTETKTRFDFLTNQVSDLHKAIGDLESAIDELEQTIKKRFGDAFERIDKEFQVYFKKLFGGGRASLELVKEDRYVDEDNESIEDEDMDDEDEDAAEEQAPAKKTEKVISGVAIYATPPGKKLKNVSTLSGGERALTSIALICAIIASNPSPFVVLDEVDAALDEANSERFAAILQSLAKRSQFITITHNRATMEHASLLYGVTMGDDGISKLLSVDIEHAEDIIKRTGNR